MANPTSNYGWVLPNSADLVTDLPADFDVALQGVDTTTKALNPSTTLGDIEYRSATANTNTRLPIGTTGQVLSVVAGVPAWTTGTTGDIEGVTAGVGISGGGTSGTVTVTNSMATAMTTKGDIVVATGSGTFARQAVGTNNQVLVADSAEADGVKWANGSAATLTTTGDTLYASAANTLARRAIGTTGQVLTVSGGLPTWATPSSGGMTVIASGTLSGATVTLSSIPQTYNNLQLVLKACLPAGGSEGPIIRFNGDTGTNYYRTTSTVVNLQSWNETQLRLGGIQDNTTSQSLAVCDILDYTNITTWKMARNMTIQNRSGSPTNFDINNTQALFWYASNGPSAITDILIKTDTSAGFTSGTYILYGVK
jgi:hypothetical protein